MPGTVSEQQVANLMQSFGLGIVSGWSQPPSTAVTERPLVTGGLSKHVHWCGSCHWLGQLSGRAWGCHWFFGFSEAYLMKWVTTDHFGLRRPSLIDNPVWSIQSGSNSPYNTARGGLPFARRWGLFYSQMLILKSVEIFSIRKSYSEGFHLISNNFIMHFLNKAVSKVKAVKVWKVSSFLCDTVMKSNANNILIIKCQNANVLYFS